MPCGPETGISHAPLAFPAAIVVIDPSRGMNACLLRRGSSWGALAAVAALLIAAVQPAAAHVGGHHSHEGEPQYVWTAVSLSIISGMAATVGGLVVIWGGVPSKSVLGHLLSFSAGVMMYISYADLLAHASQGGGTSAAAWVSALLPRSTPGAARRWKRLELIHLRPPRPRTE